MRVSAAAAMRSAGNCVRIVGLGSSEVRERMCEGASRSILLIDDDIPLCTLIAEFLSAQELHVDTVHSGPAA